MSAVYDTRLVYCFEKKGVLRDVEDERSLVAEIKRDDFERLQKEGVVSGGMIPKLHNAFEAIRQGVKAVYIGKADELSQIDTQGLGTRLID